MLGVFTFLALLLVCFLLFPITSMIIGFILGFIAIYFGHEPDAGTAAITWSSIPWRHWEFFLIAIIALTISFLLFTKKVHSSRKFAWLRIRMKKR